MPQLVPTASHAPLRMAREVVRLDYHPEKARKLLEQIGKTPRHFDGEVEVINEGGKVPFEAEVQAIALGDELAWVGLPRRDVRRARPGPQERLAVPLHHDPHAGQRLDRLRPQPAGLPRGGLRGGRHPVRPGSGERLVEAATRLLIQLKADGRTRPN